MTRLVIGQPANRPSVEIMTGLLLPQPDELYCFLAYAFAASGKGRSQIICTTEVLDRDAHATLGLVIPTFEMTRPGYSLDVLFGVLWESTKGDWVRAQEMLAEVGRPRREDVLTGLANAVAQLIARSPAVDRASSAAREELARRRRLLPRRGRLRAAPPRVLNRDADGVTRDEPTDVLSFDPRPVDQILAEFEVLPGLGAVQAKVRSILARQHVQEARRRAGLPAAERPSLHVALVGPPGTGKTMVARLLAELYAAMGLLKEPRFVEVGRDALVAMYIGQSAPKTADVVARARGGVLFLDEAYSLSGDRFAEEALAELIRQMENHRDELAVIFAGYPDKMKGFIAQNPGLASRIGIVLEFEPYTNEELWRIVELLSTQAGFLPGAMVEQQVKLTFAHRRALPGFGNARAARTLVDEMITNHAIRLCDRDEMTGDALLELTIADVPTLGQASTGSTILAGYL